MSLRWLGVSFAFTFALAAQPAAANQDVACPEGHAIRAIGDKTAVCVPVPPPVNLAPLNAAINAEAVARMARSEEHTSELQSQSNLVCRLLLEKKKKGKPSEPKIAGGDARSLSSRLREPLQRPGAVR